MTPPLDPEKDLGVQTYVYEADEYVYSWDIVNYSKIDKADESTVHTNIRSRMRECTYKTSMKKYTDGYYVGFEAVKNCSGKDEHGGVSAGLRVGLWLVDDNPLSLRRIEGPDFECEEFGGIDDWKFCRFILQDEDQAAFHITRFTSNRGTYWHANMIEATPGWV